MSAHTRTPFYKTWDAHVVRHPVGEPALIYIHQHFVHEATFPRTFTEMKRVRRGIHRPDLRLAVVNQTVPTTDRMLSGVADGAGAKATAKPQFDVLGRNSRESGIALVTDPFPREK